MKPLALAVVGIGAWSSAHRDWPALRAALADGDPGHAANADGPTRPSPAVLPAAERRRMPDGVAVAVHVAHEALLAAGAAVDVTTLASVFTSAHGDLGIVDYLCTTLATDPVALSPTRFHLSVHNAAAGYWSIALGDRAPATALAAGDDSFASGLLEAATLAVAEARPVLLVAFDTPASGLLAAAVDNSALFGFALLVRPAATDDDRWLSIALEPAMSTTPRPEHLGGLATSSPAAHALALAAALAGGDDAVVRYPIGRGTTLAVRFAHADRTTPLRGTDGAASKHRSIG